MADSTPRFAELSVSMGYITKEQAKDGLNEQKNMAANGHKILIGDVFISKGWMNPNQVQRVLKEKKRYGKQTASPSPLAQESGKLGPYELLGILGKGGMGAVYRAKDPFMNRIVALKVLSQKVTFDKAFIQRFEREVKLAGSLNHPNIVMAYGAGEENGRPYLAMELVEGETIKQRLRRSGKFSELEAMKIIKDVAAGLAHAHSMDLIHRDVKPENILLTKDGVAKLADMGLAKSMAEDEGLTKTGIALGTPNYMSPEQAKGDKRVDHRSDIYSLGATLFEMLTGEVLFKADNRMKIMLKHVNEKPRSPRQVDPRISDGTSAVVLKMLAKNPDERYDCCEDVVEDMENVLKGKPVVSATVRANPVVADSSDIPGTGPLVARKEGTGIGVPRITGRQKKVQAGRDKATRARRAKSSEGGCMLALLCLSALPLLLMGLTFLFIF